MRLRTPVYSDGLRKSTQVRFYGYDARGTEGGICDTKNLTSDYWPEMASRKRRQMIRNLIHPIGMIGGENIIWLDGSELYIDGVKVEDFEFEDTATWRQLVRLGDYISVWPDGLWYDMVSGESGNVSAEVKADGSLGVGYEIQFGDYAGRISSRANSVAIESLGPSLTDFFKEGDVVTISGCIRHPNNNRAFIVREAQEAGHGILMGTDDCFELDEYLVMTVGEDGMTAGDYNIKHTSLDGYFFVTLPDMTEGDTIEIDVLNVTSGSSWDVTITVGGVASTVTLERGALGMEDLAFKSEMRGYSEKCEITFSRKAPEMDFVFEHANRLYGCKNNTIWASKLGDICNWEYYDGTASDSWSVETGGGGSFTGACSYGGYPRFFKEERIYTLYGDYPEEFQLQEHNYLGVAKGSWKSLAAANGLLFFLSKAGPVIYQGGAPSRISETFGLVRYKSGVGGTNGTKYWISMQDENEDWHLFVYDIIQSIWIREDDMHALAIIAHDYDMYSLTADGKMIMIGRPHEIPIGAVEEQTLEWMAEFGDITYQMPSKKRVTKVMIRLELEDQDSNIIVSMKYDSADNYDVIARVSGARKRSVLLPIIPRRLDHFRIKIEGTGGGRISSMAIETAAGSDR